MADPPPPFIRDHDADGSRTTCPEDKGAECTTQCERVCLDDHLYKYVDRCCDCEEVCNLGEAAKVGALVILLFTLILLSKRRWWWFPVGRAMGPAICAVLMVASPLHILRPAYVLDQPGLMNIDTIATLFGLTIVTGCLQDFGAITWSMRLLKRECSSPRALMGRVMVLTTVLSALVTNDACVLILTQPLLDVCEVMNVPPLPFLVAIATTANLGSAWTLIGNPQNVLIAGYSGMNFFSYMLWMSPAVFVGLLLNYGFLLYFFREQLAGNFDTGAGCKTPRPWPKRQTISSPVLTSTAAEQDPSPLAQRLLFHSEGDSPQLQGGSTPGMSTVTASTAIKRPAPEGHQRGFFNTSSSPISSPESAAGADGAGASAECPSSLSLAGLVSPRPAGAQGSASPSPAPHHHIDASYRLPEDQRRKALKLAACASAVVTVLAFVFVGSIAWTVLIAVACMVLIDVYIQGGESERILAHVDGFLLVMIAALFVVIAGARRTGVPQTIYDSLGAMCPDKHEFCHYDGMYHLRHIIIRTGILN